MIALALVFDLILQGGRVVDGTGAPWFRADVGIKGDHVAAIGDLSKAKGKRIDVHELVVAPGFIDMLGQSELNQLVDPRAESKIRQGITTELTGEGVSPAPMNAAWIHENEDWLKKFHLKVNWHDLRGYFARLRKARPSINEAVLCGLGQVRGVVLGFDDVQPDAKQLKQMEKLVDACMAQGGFGVSTGLIYQPGSFAKTDEITALAKVAAKHHGFYATHMRSEGKKIFDALDETFSISRDAGIPVEIWHLKVGGKANWGRMKDVVEKIESARAAGLDVTADAYPYVASANGLDSNIPDWAHAGGVDAMIARIHDPAQRAKMLAEIRGEGFYPEDILLLSAVSPEAQKYVGKRLSEAATLLGKPPEEALIDLVAMDRANIGVARFGMSEDDVQLALKQPWVALDTDYGARAIDGPLMAEGSAHPRAYGTMPRLLGHFVRELKLLPLEEAVRKITSLPARRLGLQDRGLLRVGMKADVVVFDPATIKDTATFEKPLQYPEGIKAVLVNGQVELLDGKRTRARAGRPLLH